MQTTAFAEQSIRRPLDWTSTMSYCLVTKEHLKKQGKLSVHCKWSGSSVAATL